MINKILKFLAVIQEKKSKDAFKCNRIQNRVNPYNPLSYIVLLLFFLIAIVMFGVVGFKEKTSTENPFKWM